MTDAPASPAPRRGAWRVWAGIGVGLLVVIAAIAGLGGFSDVPTSSLPKLQLGDTHHGGELDTVITSVRLTTTAPGRIYQADEGKQYLIVSATLLNTTDHASLFGYDAVRVLLDGQVDPDEDGLGLIDPRTGSLVSFLQPGIPLDGVYTWEVDASVAEGDDIIVGLFDRFAVDDPRFSDTGYTAATATARILTTVGASR